MDRQKVISFCIPCMNRAYNLKETLPSLIEAANASPPVEILILDYNSQDDLEEYIRTVRQTTQLAEGNTLSYIKYSGRNYYHAAHALNLSVKASVGKYFVIWTVDIFSSKDFIKVMREILDNHVWMFNRKTGALVCQRQEFVDAGGYDERFEFYGPFDKDLHARLTRRVGKAGNLPGNLRVIHTPNAVKLRNFRLKLSKKEMSRRMKPIYLENNRNRVLVVNQGKEWGRLA